MLYIGLILTKLGFNENSEMYVEIHDKMMKLSNSTRNDIITDSSLINKINQLLSIDNKFKDIGEKFIAKLNNEEIMIKWNNVVKRLGELQGLVILKKLSKNNSREIISSLLSALDNKIEMINSILDTSDNNLLGGTINTTENSIINLINKNKILNFIKNNI